MLSKSSYLEALEDVDPCEFWKEVVKDLGMTEEEVDPYNDVITGPCYGCHHSVIAIKPDKGLWVWDDPFDI